VNLRDTFLLLSSDGLHDYIRKERIREIVLANGENVEKSCKDLVEEALSAGSADNITVVLAHGEVELVSGGFYYQSLSHILDKSLYHLP